MIRGSHVRDVGRPSECSLNLAAALEDLRRTEDIQWVVDKLEAAGLKEKRHIGGASGTITSGTTNRRKKEKALPEGMSAPSARDRHLLQPTDDGAIPVEDLKRIIRELKLNTGQSFWKNHVTREDLFEVLLSHFKARNPTRKPSHSAAKAGGAVDKHTKGATNIERIREELASARMRDDNARQESETSTPSFGVGVSPFLGKRAGRGVVKPQAPSNSRPSARTGWRGFDIAETRGIVYQTRVGQRHNRHRTKEFALHRRLSGGHWVFNSETGGGDFSAAGGARTDGPHLDGSETSKTLDDAIEGHGKTKRILLPNETLRNTRTKEDENDATSMRRKCAMSLYEMTTDSEKGPLLVEHGVLRALSDLSEVEDPRTIRYVGASYVNIAGFSLDLCDVMLKNQVVRCLHRLWFRGVTLAYPRHKGDSHAPTELSGGCTDNRLSIVDETGEQSDQRRARRCGLDVIDQTAEALCRLSMLLASESVITQQGGVDVIAWCAGNKHGNERLSVVGLQCLVNFHLSFPAGSLNEAVVPCLARLARSASTTTRKFTGHSICALADNKRAASQLLAGGVLSILASLPGVAKHRKGGDCGGRSAGPDDLFLETCSLVASMLAQAKDEFVRQTITAPETVAKLLDTLYLGGGGGGSGDGDSGRRPDKERGTAELPAACRLSGARVLISIFSAVDEADVVRVVQLGFLTTAARFLRQAETLQDERAEELLSHGLWCLSLNFTEVRCPAPPPPAIEPAAVGRQGSSRVLQGQDGKPSAHEGKLGVAGRTGSKRFTTRSGDPQEAPGPHHQKGTRAGQEETPEVTKSATSLRNRTLPRSGSSAMVWGADRATIGSAAVSNDVDGSGWAGSAFGRTGGEALGAQGGFSVAGEGEGAAFDLSVRNEGAELRLESQGRQSDGQADAQDEAKSRLHIVACGVMHHLLRLAESGSTAFTRNCSVGALCNLGLKPWMTADTCKEIGIVQVLIASIGDELTAGKGGTSALAAKGLWSLVSRMAEDNHFIEHCMALGVVDSLCDAIKAAAGAFMAPNEVSSNTGGEEEEEEEEEGSRERVPLPEAVSVRVSGGTGAAATAAASADVVATSGNMLARTQKKDTVEACLRALHAMLKHKWVRLDPVVKRSKEHLLTTLASCGVEAIQVDEVAMAIMCNLTHDVCCEIDLLGATGALEHAFRQALSPSRAVLKHVAGVLGNLAHVLQPTPTGCHAVEGDGVVTVFDVLKRLADTDEQRLAFRSSAILYEITRRRNYASILPDLKGLSDIVFKLFRSGLPQTQNYCLQAFFNMTRNEDFAMAIAKSHTVEAFIVGCMVHTASSRLKEVSSEVLYYLISNRWTRPVALGGQGLSSLVQIATVSRSAVSMRLALLATFNLACDLRENECWLWQWWLNELTLAAVLEFDDEVLGAPAYPGLLYLASTHHGCLQKALLTKRMAREAKVKIEGAKFLKRDRAQEEDEKFMARAAKEARPSDAEEPEDSPFEEEEQLHDERLVTTVCRPTQRSRLRHTFVASHLLPSLATVYNLCRKSANATKLFCREGVPEAIAGLLEEMREAGDDAYFHPQVEILSVAVLGCIIEDVGLVVKLIERRVTTAIVQGLGSRVATVRLSSLWYVLLLSIPVAEARSSSSSGSSPVFIGEEKEKLRSWTLFCRQAVIECKAVTALYVLWDETATSLNAEAREHVRYAISTTVKMFLMNKTTAAAVVQQRGAELLAMTTANPWASEYAQDTQHAQCTPLQHSGGEGKEGAELVCDENGPSSSPIAQVSALCCAVLTVNLPGVPVQSVCEGCLGVMLKILPTEDNDVRDICSLVMRCLIRKENLLLGLIADPRFTMVLGLLLRDATLVGGAYMRAILQRVVVLSAAPGVGDLSPALVELTDYVFHPRDKDGDDDASLTRTTKFAKCNALFSAYQRGLRAAEKTPARVVEAELPATTEETVEEGIDQLREVTARACETFHQASAEFRKHVLKTRKGQAVRLPCAPSAIDIETAGEDTPGFLETETAQSNEAESPPSRLWDPAKDILILAGMQGLEGLHMVPTWECANPQDFLQSSGSGGGGGGGGGSSIKVSLCTARFTENGKSLNCPDVAVPSPLPDELRATPGKGNKSNKSNKRDRAMPFGIEPCILAPMERCGLDIFPESSNAHRSNTASNASASVTSIVESDGVGNSGGVATSTSDEKESSTGRPSSNQLRSLHSSCSGDNQKATAERGPSLVTSLLSSGGRQRMGREGDNSDNPLHSASEDDMSEKALHESDTPPSPREAKGSQHDSADAARNICPLPSASGGGKSHRKSGGPPADQAQRGDGLATHGNSSSPTRRQNFGEVRAGIGTVVSARTGTSDALDLDSRSCFSVASADNDEGDTAAAATSKSGAEISAGVRHSPVASPTTVAGFSWSGGETVAPNGALPLRRARTSADIGARRAAQALVSDTMSLRARRRTEGRDAGQLRQQVFKSLGVGSKRTLRTASDGQGRQVVLVKVSPPSLLQTPS